MRGGTYGTLSACIKYYKQITLNRTFNENFIFQINLNVYNFVIYKYSLSILGCLINIAIKSPRSFFFHSRQTYCTPGTYYEQINIETNPQLRYVNTCMIFNLINRMVNQIHEQVIEYAYTYFYVNLYNFIWQNSFHSIHSL